MFAAVLEVAWRQEYPSGMRAARVADIACERNPELIRPHLLRIVREVPGLRDMSVKRVFMHILVRHSWVDDEEAMGGLVDALIRWLIDDNQAIAVKAYSMMILENVVAILPDLSGEITAVLEEAIPGWESAALQTTGRKMLKRLNRKGGRL